MEETVAGTNLHSLSKPDPSRQAQMLYKHIQIYLDSRCSYIYYTHSSEGGTVMQSSHEGSCDNPGEISLRERGKVASLGTQVSVDTGHGHEA